MAEKNIIVLPNVKSMDVPGDMPCGIYGIGTLTSIDVKAQTVKAKYINKVGNKPVHVTDRFTLSTSDLVITSICGNVRKKE